MQRRITGILCVWIGALALWIAADSPQWLLGESASGGLTHLTSCIDGNCPSSSYERFDEIGAWLNPIQLQVSPNEGERLFVLLGRMTQLVTQATALTLLFTGLMGLLGIGLNGSVSAPRVSLLFASSALLFSLGFISTVPVGNILGSILFEAHAGPGYALHLFGLLIGSFGAALVWQPIRSSDEAMPNRRFEYSTLSEA